MKLAQIQKEERAKRNRNRLNMMGLRQPPSTKPHKDRPQKERKIMSSFTTPLVVSPLPDGRRWKLVFEFGYDVGRKGSGDRITVPAGFVTDFASTPPSIWWVIPPWGKYGKAAVVHDYLYVTKIRTRKQADDIFREAMIILGVNPVRVFLMYWAVRLFGWTAWHHRKSERVKQ